MTSTEWRAQLFKDGWGDVRNSDGYSVIHGVGAACQQIAAEHNELLRIQSSGCNGVDRPDLAPLNKLQKEVSTLLAHVQRLNNCGYFIEAQDIDKLRLAWWAVEEAQRLTPDPA